MSGLNPEGNRGHVVLLRTGESRHVECPPIAVVVVQIAGTGARVARAGVACRDRLTGGVRNHSRTCWRCCGRWGRSRGGDRAHCDQGEGSGEDESRQRRRSAGRLVRLDGGFGWVGEAHFLFSGSRDATGGSRRGVTLSKFSAIGSLEQHRSRIAVTTQAKLDPPEADRSPKSEISAATVPRGRRLPPRRCRCRCSGPRAARCKGPARASRLCQTPTGLRGPNQPR